MLMTENDWESVKPFFKKSENWGDPSKIHKELVFGLYLLRKFVDRPVVIQCAYETKGHGGRYHPLGMAADVYIKGMNVVDQFIAASRFDVFNGIGVYPHWRPQGGLHLDIRYKTGETEADARWIRDRNGIYLPLTWQNLLKEVEHG